MHHILLHVMFALGIVLVIAGGLVVWVISSLKPGDVP